MFSSAEAGVNLELLIVYGVACFAPSAHVSRMISIEAEAV